jgi:uncharacterized membrane protein
MEPLIALVVLLVIVLPIALAIWLIARAVQTRDRIEELTRRITSLEVELFQVKKNSAEMAPAESATPVPEKSLAQKLAEQIQREPEAPATIESTPPPIISEPALEPVSMAQEPAAPPIFASEETTAPPPPLPGTPERIEAILSSQKSTPAINWEQFMGVKLFAWIGGLALFLGVAFFVKYSFEHNLISPELRVAIGFATGLALLVVGVILHRKKNYIVGAQALCATGVVILYAVTFACRSIYHFEFFGAVPTFLLMVLITATAFFLSVRLNALVVAILGMLGGFLTPILLSTGVDNPLGLFGYIAILDAGLIFVALNRRWFFLTALAAVGTVVMQIGWAAKFFESEKYFEGNKILVAFAVLLGFNALYLAANWLAKRREKLDWWLAGSTLGLVAVTLAFTAWFLDFPTLAQRPWLMFSFVFLVDAIVATLVLLDDEIAPAQTIAGLAVFGLLGFWTSQSLSNALLNAALAFYLIFAIFHSTIPILLQRRRGTAAQSAVAGHLFPILALALVLVPIFKFSELSFVVWPFILLVDVLAIVLAVLTATLLPVLAVLILTLGATGALIFKIPAEMTGIPSSFYLIGVFAIFFFAVSVWLIRKFSPDAFRLGVKFGEDLTKPNDVAAILPACSAVLPFLLLIMATLRLQLVNPSPVFGLALLLVVLVLGVTKLFSLEWMPAIGLVGVTAVEAAWHFNRLNPANPNQPMNLVLAWYLIFYAVFTLFPFLFLRRFADKVVPWAAAAFAAVPQFFFVYRLVKIAWPNEVMGLLPAAFAIPALLGLVVLLKKIPAENKSRLSQLAWFGGVALFFITLIFPIQFDRQWITIGWAAEGAALLWLFHRVPHRGLQLTGLGLLIAAFARLALNPAVLTYHPRATTPIWNWYLYTYGLVTICLFLGARLVAPPRNIILKSNAQAILASLGIILAFLLLNIEIADYFSAPGSTLTFEFEGNFARDMTYSIAWAIYALVLLIYGIAKNIPASRYAAMGLLCVTLLKLFFHDLAHLNQLYRIGALVGVAIIAMLASFAYQRFYSTSAKQKETKNEPVR